MKKTVVAAAAACLVIPSGFAQVRSLSQLYAPGKAILDLDGDGFGEKPAVTVIIPDRPSAAELALAADIAARANLESLAVDFGLVRRASEAGDLRDLPCPILIGAGLPWVREALKEKGLSPGSLGPNRGLVFMMDGKDARGIACVAATDEALLETGRAFFLRWPYFWEIWGRESGATYMALESDLARFLAEAKASPAEVLVREALYEFPVRPAAADALQGLAFDQGQVRDLVVEVRFSADADRERAAAALRTLAEGRRKGLRTEVLSYPGCARLTFELWSGRDHADVALPRAGSTKRLLTPAFRERPAADTGKEFDLLGLFSTAGVYGDQDRDGIPDAVDSTVVVPAAAAVPGLPELASRLVLGTAGGSFPLVLLDSEVESRRSLTAPILVGDNLLTRDLVRTGRLKPPALEGSRGLVRTVPGAFGKSTALVVTAPEAPGLERTLSYLSRTFPYFDEYADGRPQFRDAAADFEKFLKGEKGGAEAYFLGRLEKIAAEFKGHDLESFEARLILPRPNGKFEEAVRRLLAAAVRTPSLTVSTTTLRTGRVVFEKEKTFTWEAEDALALLREKVKGLGPERAARTPFRVSLGVSESPTVRRKLREEIGRVLAGAGVASPEIEVLSAYKQGFFWLTETVLAALKGKAVDRLTVRFSEEIEDLSRPKRTYAEPARWLQELYPVDEILARDLGLPLERIEFEMKEPGGPVYEVRAVDAKGAVLYDGRFSPRTREIPLLGVLPEWGPVTTTGGWLRVEAGTEVVLDADIRTDLEKFWTFYQDEVLAPVYAHVMRKTDQEPTFSKQPYFKRLQVELWASEPDYRIGLDEEVCSSLEALHDEIYFDTLDLLRGITRFDPDERDLPPDASRSSAPGNVLPFIHPSLEGGPARVKVTFEDWPAAGPEMTLRWKEKGREEATKKVVFPALKPKGLALPAFVYDGRAERVEALWLETEWEKEADRLAVLDIIDAYRKLAADGLLADPFSYPRLARAPGAG